MTETLSQLRTLLNTSLDVLEAELVNNSLPPFSFAPVAHPLDDPAALAPFKLYEARRAAVGALGMITNLIRPSWQIKEFTEGSQAGVIGAYGVVAKRKIANLLAEESVDSKVGLSSSALAEKAGIKDASKLARLLRILAVDQVFQETSENVFANTTEYIGKAAVYIPEAIVHEDGATAHQISSNTVGTPFFEWVYSNPIDFNIFVTAMEGYGATLAAGCLNDYPWAELGEKTLVDVGSGQGSMSFPLLAKYPNLKLLMQDLAPVLGAAVTNILQRWPQIDPSRVSFQSQDFFVDNLVEKSDDLVFMARRILHDWPDAQVVQILKGIRSAMAPKNKLLILDAVVIPGTFSSTTIEEYTASLNAVDDAKPYAPLDFPSPLAKNGGAAARAIAQIDMCMLSVLGSEERSKEHLERLLAQADLELVKIYYARSSIHVAEIVVKGSP